MNTRYRFVNVLVSVTLTLVALLGALPPAAVAQGVTCTVTSDLDDGTTPGTLRVLANDAGCDIINFDNDYTIRFGSTLNIYRTLTIDGSGHQVVLSGDTDGDGAGNVQMLGSQGSGNLTLRNLTLEKGIREGGGAVYDAATLTVVGCMFSGNRASGSGWLQGGGAICVQDGKAATVANSTFTDNTSAGDGGAIANFGTLTVINSTFSGNSAPSGGAIRNDGGTLNIYNSILVKGASGANCSGTIGGSNNLADDASCGVGFVQPFTILLGALSDYGGDTLTLPPGGAAIDAGDDAICAAAPVNNLDQRGIARPQGVHCDIGAFESQGFAMTLSGSDSQTTAVGTAFASPLQVTVSDTAGELVQGARVIFSSPATGAGTNPAIFTATVDASGAASAPATANWVAGAYDVVASIGAESVTFHLTNSGASYSLAVSGGDNQSTGVTTAFASPLKVTLKNGAGKVVPDAVITFTAPATGASTNPATFTATTSSRGIASATATANGIVGGPYEVVASTGGLAVSFHLTNSGVAVALVAGDNQSAAANTAFAVPLQVKVTGGAGKVVPGAVVTFSGPATGASITPSLATATCDSGGIASATVTANSTEGAYEVVATIDAQSVTFHLTNESPYYLNPRCECNTGVADPTSSQGLSCLSKTTKPDCEQSSYCWWRDTTPQNALAEHSAQDFSTGTEARKVYSASALTVMVYTSTIGSNVTAVVGSSEMLIIGAGGGRNEAINAKIAFQNAYSGFTGKDLVGIVWPDMHPDSTWGVMYWRNLWGSGVPVMANASYPSVLSHYNQAEKEWQRREPYTRGISGTSGITLTWGVDSFLGAGWTRVYSPTLPSYLAPVDSDLLVSADATTDVDGMPVNLIPTSNQNAGLIVYLPVQDIAIAGDLGTYFPDVGSIARPAVSIDERLATLDRIRGLTPAILILEHGLPIIGQAEALAALNAQYDALAYVRDQTLRYIGYGYNVDDIVSTVMLPSNLANSPYNQQFVGLVSWAVRQVYDEYLGWFDGDLLELAGGMSTAEFAQRLMALAGGQSGALNFVRQCVTEHTQQGAKFALYVLTSLRKIYPSAEADRLYVWALRRVAWSTRSAELRNYFLSLAKEVPLQ